MMTPAESKGCGGDDDISQKKAQYHREHYQQEESAPLTSYRQVVNQKLTGVESANRNPSLTSTGSSSLRASADRQQSPRIGDVPPHPEPAGSQTDPLLATALRYVQRADVDWSKPFIKRNGHYVDRCSVPFEWDNSWHRAVFFQSSEHEFAVQVYDQETCKVCAECRANLIIDLIDAPAQS